MIHVWKISIFFIFQDPETPDPWIDVFEADTIREMCPQLGNLIRVSHPDWDWFGEDCLHLNIYTPVSYQIDAYY